MKGGKGYDESTKSEDSSLGFYELFGMKSSYVDVQVAAKLVRGLVKKVAPRYQDGEITEITITDVVKGHDEELETLLNQMKIYPWVDESDDGTFTFSIDNKREVNRLSFFIPLEGLAISSVTEESQAESEDSGEEAVEKVQDPYAFTLSDIPTDPSPKVTFPKGPRVVPSGISDEVPEVDLWMQETRDNFDQGLEIDDEVEKEHSQYKKVDLSLFKKRYRFYKDAIKAPDGTLLSWQEHKDILLAAKNDPEKMKQAVDLSVGLVKMVVDRILRRFGTNEIYEEDDLFQAGMEGLLYGLSKLEERETQPSSYLVPCIEGCVRKVVRTQKRVFAQPEHVADMVAKYRRAQVELERQLPKFHSLTREQQEEKIAKQAGLSRVDRSRSADNAKC